MGRHYAERAALARERGRAVLEEAVSRMTGAADVEVGARLRTGDLIDAMGELEGETRFAIIGKRGEAADFAAMHLGSNLDRTVRTSNRPVLVASRAFKPITRFLIAYDGSPSAGRALERLCEGSVLKGLECHILIVGSGTPATRSVLSGAAGRLRQGGFEVTEHLAAGEPEAVIAGTVAEQDIGLLVLGGSGTSRLRRLFIGSTTLDLMRRCTVPVLIFP